MAEKKKKATKSDSNLCPNCKGPMMKKGKKNVCENCDKGM